MNDHLAGLVLGLAGSLHCAAMCGPLMLTWRRGGAAGAAWRGSGVVHLATYHGARLAMYGAAGVAAGAAGEVVTTLGAGRMLAWLAGAALLVTAVSHFTALPLVRGLPMTRILARLGQACRTRSERHPWLRDVMAGALNACLPCGMLYAALTVAASTGTPSAGLRFMLLFGLGTVPALVGAWLAADLLTPLVRNRLRYATPIALALVGLMLLARGFVGNDVTAATHRLLEPAHTH